MIYEAKKLFNGFASVRDYIVKEAIAKGEPLVIVYKRSRMTVPHDYLKGWQMHATVFKSKFNDKSYTLYDFKYMPDDQRKLIEDQQLKLL